MSAILTSWVGPAPENNGSVLILLGTEDLMKLKGESVQVTDVEWAKVVVKVVVKKGIIYGEVVRLPVSGLDNSLGSMAGFLRPLGG